MVLLPCFNRMPFPEKNPMHNKNNSQRRVLMRLVLNSTPATAMGLALSIQISVLTWLLSTKYGLNMAELGLVWAAGPVAGIVGQLFAGMTSDRIWFMGGRRRPLIVLGGISAGVMLYALNNLERIAEFLFGGSLLIAAAAVTLLLDLSINIGLGPARALVADLTVQGRERTLGFAWMQSVSGFWGVLAYLAAGLFGNDFLILTGPIFVLVFCLSTFFISESRDLFTALEHVSSKPGPTRKPPMDLYLAHAFSWLGIQCMFIYSLSFVREYIDGSGGQVLSLGFAIMSAVGFLTPVLVLGRFFEVFGALRVHISCLYLMGTGYLLIGLFAREVVIFYCLMSVVGIGWASVVSMPFVILSELSAGAKMGLSMGIFNLSVVLPQLAASLFLGVWVDRSPHKSAVFYFCAASLFVSAILWTRLERKERKTTL